MNDKFKKRKKNGEFLYESSLKKWRETLYGELLIKYFTKKNILCPKLQFKLLGTKFTLTPIKSFTSKKKWHLVWRKVKNTKSEGRKETK